MTPGELRLLRAMAFGAALFVAFAVGILVGRDLPRRPPAAPTPPAACHMRGALPDPSCSPGATDPRVTQANIATTICLAGYTASVRPSSSYTTPLKREQMARYGLPGEPADYEEDHLVPLELGGAPRDVANLWPQSRAPGNALRKDVIEGRLHDDVCAGKIPLADAQRRIIADWTGAWP